MFDRLTYLRNLKIKVDGFIEYRRTRKVDRGIKGTDSVAETQVAVDDLYRPYRPKRRTRATVAKEKGLEPLANLIMQQNLESSLMEEAAKYVDAEKEVETPEDAIAGAKDIIAEMISDDADYRTYIRELTMKSGQLCSTAKDAEAESVYEMYYEYAEALNKVAGHRGLQLTRRKERFLLKN